MIEGHELKKIRVVLHAIETSLIARRRGIVKLLCLLFSVLVIATPVFGGKCGKSLR